MTDWDFTAQKAETETVFSDLLARTGIPAGAAINLDVQTVAGPDARRSEYLSALKSAGYSGSAYSDDDGNESIEVTFRDATFDSEAIWQREEAVTLIALNHGYRPDGWGFWEPSA